ncbi:MAG TPA: glycosyltransferase family 2 protein [Anaerolineaceae bacterium]
MESLCTCSIVIPVYNGAETLQALTDRLARVLPEVAAQYELILVNDGSRDTSWAEISSLSQQYGWVRGINLMRNYGQHNATLCGVRAARFDVIITMDDDLQHPPEEIPLLLNKLAEGYDVVYGIPQKRPHSWWRNWFSVITKRVLAEVMGIRTIRDIGAFRAFRSRLREAFESYCNPNVILDVLLSWGTSRFATVIVEEKPRELGQSNYNFYKLFKITMVVVTGFSTLPLRFASLLGFGFTLFGILIFLYVLVITLLKGSIPGFPFLASMIALFSGTQLFAVGIIGEYLARIFDRSMDRPPYMVGEETSASQIAAGVTTPEPTKVEN